MYVATVLFDFSAPACTIGRFAETIAGGGITAAPVYDMHRGAFVFAAHVSGCQSIEKH